MRLLKPPSAALAVMGMMLFVATTKAIATPVEIPLADVSGWTATSQTGAGIVSFVPSERALTPVLGIPVVPLFSLVPLEFALFEQIGPDLQTLESPSFVVPSSPEAPSGSLQPVTFTWLMANDNYASPPLHGPQEVRVAVTSNTGEVFELFRGDDGPANPHAPTSRAAVLMLTVGSESVAALGGSAQYRILVEAVATDNFNILRVGSFSIQTSPVPEPPSIALLITGLITGAAGLTTALGFGRFRCPHPSRPSAE